MKGLRYLFPGPFRFWTVIIFFLLLAIGCQDGCRCIGCGGCNGCTTSVVVDQESRKIKVDGVRMKLIANKNRVTNRKLKLDSVIYVDKTVWYNVDFHLKLADRPEIRNICEYDVEEKQDLEKSLDKFNLQFSPDKQHFAVGLNNKVYDFFHLLAKNVPFSSGTYYLNDTNHVYISKSDIDFKAINWNRFPNPDELLDKIIVPNNYNPWALECNQSNVLNLLQSLPPGNNHDLVLMKNWYSDIANQHFSRQRVEAIVKVSPEWLNVAQKSLIGNINHSISENDPELHSSLNMVLWINDKNLLNLSDSSAFSDYRAKGFAGDYFIERFNNKTFPVQTRIYTKILAESRKMCSNGYYSSESISLVNAVELLLLIKDYPVLKTFLNNNINSDTISFHGLDIIGATIEKFNKYPKELQTLMVANYQRLLENEKDVLFAYDISQIMEFLKDKIDCKALKHLAEKHKDKLIGFILPRNCQ